MTAEFTALTLAILATPPQATPEEALAAAEDRLKQRLAYRGKGD
jgi:hypothetical protein